MRMIGFAAVDQLFLGEAPLPGGPQRGVADARRHEPVPDVTSASRPEGRLVVPRAAGVGSKLTRDAVRALDAAP